MVSANKDGDVSDVTLGGYNEFDPEAAVCGSRLGIWERAQVGIHRVA